MQNQEIQKSKEREASPNWNVLDVIFIVLPMICIVFVPLGGLFYLCGRLNYHIGMVVFMAYPVIGVFIIYCFIAGILRLLRYLGKRNRTIIIHVAEIIIPIVFVVLFIIPFFIPIESGLWPPGKAFTYGFRDRIRSKADIEAIRDWLRAINKEDYNDFGVRLHRDKWPKSLKALSPGTVHLSTDNNDNPQVRITWGAAMFHWGLTIGMEDMEIPASDLNRWYESWLLVEPGVYVWDM